MWPKKNCALYGVSNPGIQDSSHHDFLSPFDEVFYGLPARLFEGTGFTRFGKKAGASTPTPGNPSTGRPNISASRTTSETEGSRTHLPGADGDPCFAHFKAKPASRPGLAVPERRQRPPEPKVVLEPGLTSGAVKKTRVEGEVVEARRKPAFGTGEAKTDKPADSPGNAASFVERSNGPWRLRGARPSGKSPPFAKSPMRWPKAEPRPMTSSGPTALSAGKKFSETRQLRPCPPRWTRDSPKGGRRSPGLTDTSPPPRSSSGLRRLERRA